MSIQSQCPSCKSDNTVGEEMIGRYTKCVKCSCRFYVEVPLPEELRKAASLHEPSHLKHPALSGTSDGNLSAAVGQASNATHRIERQITHILLGLAGLAALALLNTALLVVELVR